MAGRSMDFSTYISQVSFRAIGPEADVRPDGRLTVTRASGVEAGLLELPGSPVDFINVLRSFGDRIRVAPAAGEADTLRPAIDLTRGELVAFADGTARLRPTAVEIGMTFPRPSRFNRTLDDEQIRGLEQALAA